MSFHKTTGLDFANLAATRGKSENGPGKDYIYYWQLWHHNWDDTDIECILSHCDLAEKRVLEVGCGDGRVAFAIAPQCREIIAIDLDARFIEIADQRLSTVSSNLQFMQMDAQKLELADESFDCVLYPWVLQMVPDKTLAMKEAFRVLKPGGELFLIGLRSDADYDTIIGKFVKGIDAIDIRAAYEMPIRDCFAGPLTQTTQTFKYFFHTKKLALDAFAFAISYWYSTPLTDSLLSELNQLLENFKVGERICIGFPAEIYRVVKS